MIKLYEGGVYLVNNRHVVSDNPAALEEIKAITGESTSKEKAKEGTIAHGILMAHNVSGDDRKLKIKFDALTSHDITYVGIIQTARASGMTKFPIPYVLTNCHNSLCAVGGTINEDDHVFALSAAKKYGGIYVPTNLAVIHQYNREMMSGCGKMILGSDSHTRYGALGTMAVGEGGGELAKQLVGHTYDISYPKVVAVYLSGSPNPGVGPQDVALSIIGKVFAAGYVKNAVMEFVGEGVEGLSVEYRSGIDVMTTETTCWSSIWQTDSKVEEYFTAHGRREDYKPLAPKAVTYYDGMVHVDLSKVKPSIALPFHPSNVYTIEELKASPHEILAEVERNSIKQLEGSPVKLDLLSKIRGKDIYVDQGVIAGCAGGTFDNIVDAADILNGRSIGSEGFTMSVYPSSQPTYMQLVKNGTIARLMESGIIVRAAFCGPCFGAGDTPANNQFSIRHTTRNFPNREGSKPGEGQISSVALMDARSIAATAANGGKLTAADELDLNYTKPTYFFDQKVYDNRVYNGWGRPELESSLVMGPNIKDWPRMPALTNDLLVKVVTHITDPVTTTDELIPSGETSSYRSNPLRLAEFTLSRKAPDYVPASKVMLDLEQRREAGANPVEISSELAEIYRKLGEHGVKIDPAATGIGSAIYANKPGDGSAREQAASCQKVLGGWANFAMEYATKRYRSNLINWGILPFLVDSPEKIEKNNYVFVPQLVEQVRNGSDVIEAYVVGEAVEQVKLRLGDLTADERQTLIDGCLINYYSAR